ncbi:MAG: FAD-binding protein [Saprospiraceae bacterium]|nr:FAD-binding protein [Saprospiraceae bacterium]
MNNSKIPPSVEQQIVEALGQDCVFTDNETLEKHSRDQSKNLTLRPDMVVKPHDTEGLSRLFKICNTHGIPVTIQGGLSGLTGAALTATGGIALSMERFDKILDIDKANFQVTVEAGVITEHLYNVLKNNDLFYPPDPQGKGWSFIGGNINTNAGGPKCVKYGVTRDYVLNLEIVLPSGEVMWTSSNTLKFSTCYNLTHLIVGSEGTLAVVTKAVLKLLPLPTVNLLLLASFPEAEDACTAVAAIFQAGVVPSGLEYMEWEMVNYSARYLGVEPLSREHDAFLLIEVDGNNLDILHQDCEKIATVLQDFKVGDILFADNETQKNELWKLRRNAGNAMINLSKERLGEDTVVPRAALPAQLKGVREIAQKYGVKIASLGHLGDGNMHINILADEEPTEEWYTRAKQAKRAIFELTKSLNGMLSAEHGVGITQTPFLDVFFNNTHREILRGIKKVFDPKGILNPHKFV